MTFRAWGRENMLGHVVLWGLGIIRDYLHRILTDLCAYDVRFQIVPIVSIIVVPLATLWDPMHSYVSTYKQLGLNGIAMQAMHSQPWALYCLQLA